MAEASQQKPATTLGDVLYAKSAAPVPVPEQAWSRLVESIAAGDQAALHELYEMAHRGYDKANLPDGLKSAPFIAKPISLPILLEAIRSLMPGEAPGTPLEAR